MCSDPLCIYFYPGHKLDTLCIHCANARRLFVLMLLSR